MSRGVELVHRADQPDAERGLDLDGFASLQEAVEALEDLDVSAAGGRRPPFRDPLNELFSTPDTAYVPLRTAGPVSVSGRLAHDEREVEEGEEESVPWRLSTRQFCRTLAWHIAHQPFGVVAGSRQYQHAELALFEGYAGTSASGFAAEVAAERAIAQLDYVEDLYRDWNERHRTSGGAAGRLNAEFDRIRRVLGGLPGITASPVQLRTMLQHLTKTFHPGILNDCFYQPSSALCAKRTQHTGRPLPLVTMCLTCPNARRSSVHLPRLTTARAQAQRPLDAPDPPRDRRADHPHRRLDQAIAELRTPEHSSSALTVSTLCTEEGISRATYYRSPLAEIITGFLQTPDAPQFADRRQTPGGGHRPSHEGEPDPALQKAAEQREPRATIATYANYIQALTCVTPNSKRRAPPCTKLSSSPAAT